MKNENKHESIAPSDIKNVIAEIPREQLKSLFYLFSGKPDSRIKVFSDPIHIKREDILELNNCVLRKLGIHSIDATMSSVKIGYVGQNLNEFGTWAEFEHHHWQEPERVEEIVLKWDFLVKVQEFAMPQRHTLLVRISSDLKPGKVLQMLASGNSDEFEQLDTLSAPAFCRVDFINAQLSKELINVVDDWYKGRVSPTLIPETLYKFKSRRRLVAEIFDHWFMLSWVLILTSLSLWAAQKYYSLLVPIHIVGIALFIAVYSLRPIARIANIMATGIFNTLKELEGSKVLFEFTSGDKKRIAELTNENKQQGKKFYLNGVSDFHD